MDSSLMKRVKEPEDENRRLKKMYAEERINSEIRKDAAPRMADHSNCSM